MSLRQSHWEKLIQGIRTVFSSLLLCSLPSCEDTRLWKPPSCRLESRDLFTLLSQTDPNQTVLSWPGYTSMPPCLLNHAEKEHFKEDVQASTVGFGSARKCEKGKGFEHFSVVVSMGFRATVLKEFKKTQQQETSKMSNLRVLEKKATGNYISCRWINISCTSSVQRHCQGLFSGTSECTQQLIIFTVEDLSAFSCLSLIIWMSTVKHPWHSIVPKLNLKSRVFWGKPRLFFSPAQHRTLLNEIVEQISKFSEVPHGNVDFTEIIMH